MDSSSELDKIHLLPKPVTNNDAIPVSCSVTSTGDILLRNDGFNAEAAYTLDNFYAHMANILGNMERMKVDGAVLQVGQDPSGKKSIKMFLLYDARVLLGTKSTVDKSNRIHTVKVPGQTPGILHTNPEKWSFKGALPDGTRVSFKPIYDIPLNYTKDVQNSPEATEPRNTKDQSIVVAYAQQGVVSYALDRYASPSKPQQVMPNEKVADAIVLVIREVTNKIARLKGLK